ncbi:MAG: twin-arginine translocase TatA/TatE family subunit [bacterium]|nr:twin-arginine translocase TatA/TatE family subunit [bacterium]
MFSNFGATEIAIIAFLLILFFGGRKIPEFVKGLGEAIREFKKGVKDDK